MEKLNELVKLAKRATSGEWNAFISAGGDGTFSIHTPDDSRKGNVVNWPGFDTANCSKAQKKANAKYIAAAHPDALLAVAEAFRELEQRAEAAEHERDCHMDIAEHFKARCKELEQQKPYGYVHNLVDPPGGGVAASIFKEESRHYGRPVFTRPAPAINLADLVPDGWKLVPVEPTEEMLMASYMYASVYSAESYRAMLAAAPEPE